MDEVVAAPVGRRLGAARADRVDAAQRVGDQVADRERGTRELLDKLEASLDEPSEVRS